jgi:cell division septation protein DedD
MAFGALPLAALFAAALRAAWVPDGEGERLPSDRVANLEVAERGAADGARTAEAARAAAAPLEVPWSFSVALAAFRERDEAATYASELRRKAAPDWVGLAPVVVNDAIYYRVLAGLERDSSSADSLRFDLAARMNDAASRLLVRRAGLAFVIAEEADMEGAMEWVVDLRGRGLSAYVLRVSHDAGSSRYRVYVGAYADEPESRHLAKIISQHGMEARLTERVGTPLP